MLSVLSTHVTVGTWLARLTAVREVPGSNRTADKFCVFFFRTKTLQYACCFGHALHTYCVPIDSAFHTPWDVKVRVSL